MCVFTHFYNNSTPDFYAKVVEKNCIAEMRWGIKLQVWHHEAGLKVLVSLDIVFVKTVCDTYCDVHGKVPS